MLDCKGAMRPKAGLAREDLLINVSEIKKKKKKRKSPITVLSGAFVVFYLRASKEERRGLLRCYKSGRDLKKDRNQDKKLQKDKERNCRPLCERGIKQ